MAKFAEIRIQLAKRAFKGLIQLLALNLLQNSVPQVVQAAQKCTRILQEGNDFVGNREINQFKVTKTSSILFFS